MDGRTDSQTDKHTNRQTDIDRSRKTAMTAGGPAMHESVDVRVNLKLIMASSATANYLIIEIV